MITPSRVVLRGVFRTCEYAPDDVLRFQTEETTRDVSPVMMLTEERRHPVVALQSLGRTRGAHELAKLERINGELNQLLAEAQRTPATDAGPICARAATDADVKRAVALIVAAIVGVTGFLCAGVVWVAAGVGTVAVFGWAAVMVACLLGICGILLRWCWRVRRHTAPGHTA